MLALSGILFSNTRQSSHPPSLFLPAKILFLPSGELEPRDRVGSWLLDDELHGDGPDRILSRCEDHRVTADGPTVAENLHHVMPRISRWLWTNRYVDRAARVHDDAIFRRAFRAVRHNYAVHFHVQILTRTGIDQPWLVLAIFLEMTKEKENIDIYIYMLEVEQILRFKIFFLNYFSLFFISILFSQKNISRFIFTFFFRKRY